jgi:hypothetical protein
MATTVTKTIRASGNGGDYTLLSSWEAAIPSDLVTEDEQWIAECYNDEFDTGVHGLEDSLNVDGHTTDATRNIVIRAASGSGNYGSNDHDGDKDSGFKIFSDGTQFTKVISILDDYVTVENIVVENKFSTSTGKSAIECLNNGVKVHNCILIGGAYQFYPDAASPSVTPELYQCLLIGTGSGVSLRFNRNCEILNCVFSGQSTGLDNSNGATVKNTVFYNVTTEIDSTSGLTTATNATSNSSLGNIGSDGIKDIASTDFEYAANDDYHLSSTSNLIGEGTNLYSDFTTDIDGDTWPSSGAWDIGFDYYVSDGITGSGTPTATAATASGAGVREITASGTPQANTATTAGSGTVAGAITGTAETTAQAATTAGVGLRVITGTGTPQAQNSSATGSGVVGENIVGNGAPQATTATVTGVGLRVITGTGTPQANTATVNGVAEREIIGSGSPQAETATTTGSGAVGDVTVGSGNPQAQVATATGTGLRIVKGSGTPQANTATTSATGEITGSITGDGEATAQTATANGVGLRVITGSGAGQAQTATAYGYETASTIHPGRIYTKETENRVYTKETENRVYKRLSA